MNIKLILGMVLLQAITPVLVEAQPQPQQTLPANSQVPSASTEPEAVVLKVRGKCDYSEDGITFIGLKDFTAGAAVQGDSSASGGAPTQIGSVGGGTINVINSSSGVGAKKLWGHIFKEGAVIRTGEDGQADIFFRGIGTTVRLQPDTEIKLEKMARRVKEGAPVMDTLLDLTKGRICTVVRSFVPGSTFEIRNAAGRTVIEGGGDNGRYIIAADGTHVADKNSDIPLKVIGEKGVTIVLPGQKFLAKEGKLLPLDPSESESLLIESDELRALTEDWDKLQAPK